MTCTTRTARRRAPALERTAAWLCLAAPALLGVLSPDPGRAQTAADAGSAPAAGAQQPRALAVLDDAAHTDEGRVVDIPVLANDRDPGGGALSVLSVTQPAHGWVLVNGDDTLRYQPGTGFTGSDGFAYTAVAADGSTASARVQVTVAGTPDEPVAENQAVATDEDIALSITLVGADADGDPLRFEIDRPPAHGALSGAPPEVFYSPAADYHGPDSFVFSVHDGRGGSDTGVVSIRIDPVADAPLARDDVVETEEGRVLDIRVLANDLDPDGDLLHIASIKQPANGWVLINGDGTLRYQPYTGFTGVDGFAYTVADVDGATASAAVSVVVRNVPDAPVAENQTFETDEDIALAITLSGGDADGDPLHFEIDRPPAHGALSGEPPDVLYTPAAHYYGSDTFVFSVHDGRGGSDTGVVSIRIDPVADAPIARDDAAETEEGRVVDIPVLANDSDPDGEPVRLVSIAQPAHGWVLTNGDDTLRYQPYSGFAGKEGFAYTIADASGTTASASVSVVVRNVPNAPLAEDQALWTEEDIALSITLAGVDPDGDPLRFRIEQLPANGTLSGGLPDVLYTPNPDYHGLDGFVFSVDDGQGGSDEGVVSIRVDPMADVPLARDDVADTDEGRVVDIPVLKNDLDPDGDVLHLVSIVQPAHGWVLINGDDTLRYQPYTGFTGTDGFAYTVADVDGATASATVSIAVHLHSGGSIRE